MVKTVQISAHNVALVVAHCSSSTGQISVRQRPWWLTNKQTHPCTCSQACTNTHTRRAMAHNVNRHIYRHAHTLQLP